MLIILLGLHSLCWLSFLAHIRDSLELNVAPNAAASMMLMLTTNGFQQQSSLSPYAAADYDSQQTNQWQAYKLLYAFGLSNLLFVMLVCWCERRHLQRASVLLGLKRGFKWCQMRSSLGAGSINKFSSTKSQRHLASNATFYETTTTSANLLNHHPHHLIPQHHSASSSVAYGGLTASQSQSHLAQNKIARAANANQTAGRPKISPSSQSLFLISSGRTGAGPAPPYGHAQQQQHLYQPIYGDSNLALDERQGPRLESHQLVPSPNRSSQLQMMAAAQQQNSFTLNRQTQHQQAASLMILDPNLKHQQQQQQQLACQQQQQFQAPDPSSRTLGYQRAAGLSHHHQQQAHQYHQQQQQQQHMQMQAPNVARFMAGPVPQQQLNHHVQHQAEAEGPLLALGNSGSSSSASTSSSSDQNQNPSANLTHSHNQHNKQQMMQLQLHNQHHLQQHQHQQAMPTPSAANLYEHQLFANKQPMRGGQMSAAQVYHQAANSNQHLQVSGGHFRTVSQLHNMINTNQHHHQFGAQHNSSPPNFDDDNGHIYDTAQNCYASSLVVNSQ